MKKKQRFGAEFGEEKMLNIKKLRPTKCNICGGRVEYIGNGLIYGKPYGSGYCYHCTNCGAYVGTHKVRPKEAFGILANKEMRQWKMKCHDIFDSMWETPNQRKKMYKWLAKQMSINISDCHFGYFDLMQLKKAYDILQRFNHNERRGKECTGQYFDDKSCIFGIKQWLNKEEEADE